MGVLLLAAHGQQVKPGPPDSDPIFGIPYNSAHVHFETAPASIARICKEARGRGRVFSLYAYWKQGDDEYFVVSDAVSDETGIGVVLRHGTDCYETQAMGLIWGLNRTAPQKGTVSIKVPETALEGLASDLLRRYAIAFGGKEAFLRAVHHLNHFDPADLGPVLGRHFEEYVKTH